mmetsp:Transcript_22835/g.58146  ORF Transcript_22835/g.58146 Transcript_22835/m.58146 type:complete len:214 (-) Transcript_22835:506-1147(-)
MPQMKGFLSTLFTSADQMSGLGLLSALAATFLGSGPSTGGYPQSSGLSLAANSTMTPTSRPMMPGAHMPHFQPMALAKPPATRGAAKPPRLCAMFHMPQYVPRSLDANQVVRMRAQQGPPTPCSVPLSAQKKQNHASEVPKPNAMLTAAVSMRPPASSSVGENLAPTTPLMNLLMPYAMGKMEVMAPICVMSMPSVGSATMTGAVYVRLLRVR